MKYNFILIFSIALIPVCHSTCSAQEVVNDSLIRAYIPADKELYTTIVSMDKEYFDAYNSCDLEKQAFLYSDNLEFFHDKGGLTTSKQEVLEAISKNICGKVTREIVENSIEVYPIYNYGAVEIGYHKFYNNQEPEAIASPSKFIIVWKNDNGLWKLSKVISLH
jgi:hypothetical protein